MEIMRSIRDAAPAIHREGWPFIAATLALAVLSAFMAQPLFWLLLVLAGWMAIFFRNPVRVSPAAPGLVLSPADGRIEPIVTAVPPAELGLGMEPLTRISVFMNVFDCHINRAPLAGRVLRVAYKAGRFLSADLDKASEANERNGLIIEAADGAKVGVVQIAGLVARRILCWTSEGADLAAGERIGMIRFGSRLDVYLPPQAEPSVALGQWVRGGSDIIARIDTASYLDEPPRAATEG